MSVLGKQPLIDELLYGLEKSDLESIYNSLNNTKFTEYSSALALYDSEYQGTVFIPGFNGVYIKHTLLIYDSRSQILTPARIDSDGKMVMLEQRLSIDELRNNLRDKLIEAGSIDVPTKPIHAHTIRIVYNTETVKIKLSCTVFNNSNTAFTMSSFKDYMDAEDELSIMASGTYLTDGDVLNVAFIGSASDGYSVSCNKAEDGLSVAIKSTTWTDVFPAEATLEDSVVKIN